MKWEYTTVLADARKGFGGGKFDVQALTDHLNELGEQGWELVTSFGTNQDLGSTRDVVLIMKRGVSTP